MTSVVCNQLFQASVCEIIYIYTLIFIIYISWKYSHTNRKQSATNLKTISRRTIVSTGSNPTISFTNCSSSSSSSNSSKREITWTTRVYNRTRASTGPSTLRTHTTQTISKTKSTIRTANPPQETTSLLKRRKPMKASKLPLSHSLLTCDTIKTPYYRLPIINRGEVLTTIWCKR